MYLKLIYFAAFAVLTVTGAPLSEEALSDLHGREKRETFDAIVSYLRCQSHDNQ